MSILVSPMTPFAALALLMSAAEETRARLDVVSGWRPVRNPSAGPVPFSLTTDPSGNVLVTEADMTNASVSSYRVRRNGSLSVLTPTVHNGQAATCWINWVGDRAIAYSNGQATPPDIQEAFAFGHDRADLAARVDNVSAQMYAPNIWPDQPRDFKNVMVSYYGAMMGLAQNVLRAMAVALGAPENYFADKFDRQASVCRMIRYPAVKETPCPGQLRAVTHTDCQYDGDPREYTDFDPNGHAHFYDNKRTYINTGKYPNISSSSSYRSHPEWRF